MMQPIILPYDKIMVEKVLTYTIAILAIAKLKKENRL